MKFWQVALLLVLAVGGVALVVYFATHHDSASGVLPSSGGTGTTSTPADIVTGIGTGVTSIGAAIARAATPAPAGGS